MSLSRKDLIKKMNEVLSDILREKGYVSFIDVLIKMGKLNKEDYENWRFRRVPYLEKVIKVNLVKVNHMLRTFHGNAKHGGLKSSSTSYMSWGKGPKVLLRFSKTGDPGVEAAYSTHFIRPKQSHNNGLHTYPA